MAAALPFESINERDYTAAVTANNRAHTEDLRKVAAVLKKSPSSRFPAAATKRERAVSRLSGHNIQQF
jgi:hypothetical protein